MKCYFHSCRHIFLSPPRKEDISSKSSHQFRKHFSVYCMLTSPQTPFFSLACISNTLALGLWNKNLFKRLHPSVFIQSVMRHVLVFNINQITHIVVHTMEKINHCIRNLKIIQINWVINDQRVINELLTEQ